MKVIHEKVIEMNNKLFLNVNKQQDEMKHLKEQCDIDDDHEIHKVRTYSTQSKRISLCL